MAARKKAARKTSGGRRKAAAGTARAVESAATEAAWSTARATSTGAAGAERKRAATKAASKAAKSKGVKKAASPKAAAARKATGERGAKPRADRGTRKVATRPARTGEPALMDEVEALAQLMDLHGLVEVSYELTADGSKHIHVSRAATGSAPAVHHTPAAASHAPVAPPAPAAAEPIPAPAEPVEELHVFTSPMVGTFYRAPSPEAPPFVSVGDKVDPSTVVCIIEAMKVMNEISPDAQGEIVSIEVENGAAVEFGQPLMLIRPR